MHYMYNVCNDEFNECIINEIYKCIGSNKSSINAIETTWILIVLMASALIISSAGSGAMIYIRLSISD